MTNLLLAGILSFMDPAFAAAPSFGHDPFPFSQGLLKKDQQLCPDMQGADQLGWIESFWGRYVRGNSKQAAIAPQLTAMHSDLLKKCAYWSGHKQDSEAVAALGKARNELAAKAQESQRHFTGTALPLIAKVKPALETLAAHKCMERLNRVEKLIQNEVELLKQDANFQCPE